MGPLDITQVWSPLIQGGFAIFALLLLIINVWLVRQLLTVLRDNNKIVAGNTRAIEAVAGTSGMTRDLMQEIRDELLRRPCLIPEDRIDEDRVVES